MERQKAKLAKKKISDDVRTSGGNSYSIPLNLIPDILKGLSVKTLARFLCVSKPWRSIIRNRDFVKSYLIKSSSSTHPQSLFTFKSKRHGKNFFFSSSQPQKGDESLSSVASYHMKCHSQPYTAIYPSVHGLICYGPPSKLIMVYNPSTRRSITLPKIDSHRIRMYHFLGYDPIDGDYKMLCMSRAMHVRRGRGLAQKIQVLTLGNGNSWRMDENCPPHSPETPHICIDGVLFYGAYFDMGTRNFQSYVNNSQSVSLFFEIRYVLFLQAFNITKICNI